GCTSAVWIKAYPPPLTRSTTSGEARSNNTGSPPGSHGPYSWGRLQPVSSPENPARVGRDFDRKTCSFMRTAPPGRKERCSIAPYVTSECAPCGGSGFGKGRPEKESPPGLWPGGLSCASRLRQPWAGAPATYGACHDRAMHAAHKERPA